MSRTIFYSWQSDIRAAACRTLIEDALLAAAQVIGRDESVGVEPAIDRDTQDVAGSPDIAATILAKIDAADAFVADVTIVNSGAVGRPTPNPNVLVELGYALKSLTSERVVLVQNVAFGGPEQLPFDLRQKRTITYSSAADAAERVTERRELQLKLERAMREILKKGPARGPRVELRLDYEKKQISAQIHHYELVAALQNDGNKRFDDWEIEVDLPTALLEPGVVYGHRDANRSNADRSVFVTGDHSLNVPLRPGDVRKLTLDYRVDEAIHRRREELYGQLVKARAFIEGELAAETARPVVELQCF